MSVVTDVILLLNADEIYLEESEESLPDEIESEGLKAVNAWLAERGYGELFPLSKMAIAPDRHSMQALVYGGAYNHLDDDEFAEFVSKQQWRSPQNVQLLLKHEFEEKFSLHIVPLASP